MSSKTLLLTALVLVAGLILAGFAFVSPSAHTELHASLSKALKSEQIENVALKIEDNRVLVIGHADDEELVFRASALLATQDLGGIERIETEILAPTSAITLEKNKSRFDEAAIEGCYATLKNLVLGFDESRIFENARLTVRGRRLLEDVARTLSRFEEVDLKLVVLANNWDVARQRAELVSASFSGNMKEALRVSISPAMHQPDEHGLMNKRATLKILVTAS